MTNRPAAIAFLIVSFAIVLAFIGCTAPGGGDGGAGKSNGKLTAYLADIRGDLNLQKGHTDSVGESLRLSADKSASNGETVAEQQSKQIDALGVTIAKQNGEITTRDDAIKAYQTEWFSPRQHAIAFYVILEGVIAIALYIVGIALPMFYPASAPVMWWIVLLAKIGIVVNPFGMLGVLIWYESKTRGSALTAMNADSKGPIQPTVPYSKTVAGAIALAVNPQAALPQAAWLPMTRQRHNLDLIQLINRAVADRDLADVLTAMLATICELQTKISTLETGAKEMANTLADIQTATAAQNTLIASLTTFVQGLQAQLSGIGGLTADQQAQVDQIFAGVTADNASINAIIANTPAATAPVAAAPVAQTVPADTTTGGAGVDTVAAA